MIKPTKVYNNIPFLYNKSKVRTLNRHLESNEPQIPLPKSYVRNTLERQLGSEFMDTVISDSDNSESEGLISKKKIHVKSQESLTSGMTESVITSPGETRDGKGDEDLKLNK